MSNSKFTQTPTPFDTNDPRSWRIGYQAGIDGSPSRPPPGVDEISWFTGKLEGAADRRLGLWMVEICERLAAATALIHTLDVQ